MREFVDETPAGPLLVRVSHRLERLAQHAGTDPMLTSQVTRRLEAGGLLERAPDPADGGARRLAPTPAGLALVARALTDVEADDEAFSGALGDGGGGFADALARLATPPPDAPG